MQRPRTDSRARSLYTIDVSFHFGLAEHFVRGDRFFACGAKADPSIQMLSWWDPIRCQRRDQA